MDLTLRITPDVNRRLVDEAAAVVSDVEARGDAAVLSFTSEKTRVEAEAEALEAEIARLEASYLDLDSAWSRTEMEIDAAKLQMKLDLEKNAQDHDVLVLKHARLKDEQATLVHGMARIGARFWQKRQKAEAAFHALEAEIDKVEQQIQQNKTDVEYIDVELETLERERDAILAQQDIVEAKHDSIGLEIETTKAELADIESRVEKARSAGWIAGQAMTAITRAIRLAARQIRGTWANIDDMLNYVGGIMGNISSAAWSAAILSKLQGAWWMATIQITTAVQSAYQQTQVMADRQNARRQEEYNRTVMMGD